MNTTIAPTGRVVERVTRELSDADQARITQALAEHGIRVEPVIDVLHVLHLWALQPTTTRQEVEAIAAYSAATDARLFFHAFKEVTR